MLSKFYFDDAEEDYGYDEPLSDEESELENEPSELEDEGDEGEEGGLGEDEENM